MVSIKRFIHACAINFIKVSKLFSYNGVESKSNKKTEVRIRFKFRDSLSKENKVLNFNAPRINSIFGKAIWCHVALNLPHFIHSFKRIRRTEFVILQNFAYTHEVKTLRPLIVKRRKSAFVCAPAHSKNHLINVCECVCIHYD